MQVRPPPARPQGQMGQRKRQRKLVEIDHTALTIRTVIEEYGTCFMLTQEKEYGKMINESQVSSGSIGPDDVQLGLLYGYLTLKLKEALAMGPVERDDSFNLIRLTSIDGFLTIRNALMHLLLYLYPRLRPVVKTQIVLMVGELLKTKTQGMDDILIVLLRRIMGGSTSQSNINLCTMMLDLFAENPSYLDPIAHLEVMRYALITFVRVSFDHRSTQLTNLQKREADFATSLFLRNTKDCIEIGRDLIRWFQAISKLESMAAVWPVLMERSADGVPLMEKILNIPTPGQYLVHRVPIEAEMQLKWCLENLTMGSQGRHFEWFQTKFMKGTSDETIIVDLLRFVCACYHPSNEMLDSQLLTRYAVVAWLLGCSKSNATAADAKLALFYDWMFYKPEDSIMNIEAAMLVMSHTMEKYPQIALSCLEFLYLVRNEFYIPLKDDITRSIALGFRELESLKVIPSVAGFLASPNIREELRKNVIEAFVDMSESESERFASASTGATTTVKRSKDPRLNPNVINRQNIGEMEQYIRKQAETRVVSDDGSCYVVYAMFKEAAKQYYDSKGKGKMHAPACKGKEGGDVHVYFEYYARIILRRWFKDEIVGKIKYTAQGQASVSQSDLLTASASLVMAQKFADIVEMEIASGIDYKYCYDHTTPLVGIIYALLSNMGDRDDDEQEKVVRTTMMRQICGCGLVDTGGDGDVLLSQRVVIRILTWVMYVFNHNHESVSKTGEKDKGKGKDARFRKVFKVAQVLANSKLNILPVSISVSIIGTDLVSQLQSRIDSTNSNDVYKFIMSCITCTECEETDSGIDFLCDQLLTTDILRRATTSSAAITTESALDVDIYAYTELIHSLVSMVSPSNVMSMCLSLGCGVWKLFTHCTIPGFTEFLKSTLTWDSYEQMILWQLLQNETLFNCDVNGVFFTDIAADLIPYLRLKVHHEAVSAIVFILGQLPPNVIPASVLSKMLTLALTLEAQAETDADTDTKMPSEDVVQIGLDSDIDIVVIVFCRWLMRMKFDAVTDTDSVGAQAKNRIVEACEFEQMHKSDSNSDRIGYARSRLVAIKDYVMKHHPSRSIADGEVCMEIFFARCFIGVR